VGVSAQKKYSKAALEFFQAVPNPLEIVIAKGTVEADGHVIRLPCRAAADN